MKKTTIILFLCGICLFVGNVSARSGRGSALSQACMYASGQLEVSDFTFLHDYVGGGIYSKSLIPKEAMKPIQTCNNGPLCVDVFVAGSQYFQNQDIVTYTVSATNNSSATMAVIEFTVNLPTQLTYVSTGSSAWASSGSVCIIQAANVLPSQTVSFTLVAKVGASNTSNCFVPMLTSATAATQYTNGWLYVTETEAVYLLPDAVQTRLYNAQSSTIGTSLSGFVFSEGTFTIDNGFSFQNSQLLMAQDASINVGNGSNTPSLTLSGTTMYGCLRMWNEIKVENGAKLETNNNSIVSDGYYAIHARQNACITIKDTRFEDDFVGLFVPNGLGVTTTFGGLNIFQTSGNNLLPMPSQQTVSVGARGYAGIVLNGDGYMDVKGCQFIGLNSGIKSLKSILNVKDCYFENIYEDFTYNTLGGSPNLNTNGVGISVGRYSFLTYTGISPATDFEDCQTGIFAYIGTTLRATEAQMRGIKEWGIRYVLPYGGASAEIVQNAIDTDGNGISIEYASPSPGVKVWANSVIVSPNGEQEGIGIQVLETSLTSPDNVLVGPANGVTLFRPGHGIWVNGCNGTTLEQNNVTIDPNVNILPRPGGSNCFLLTGSTNLTLECNFAGGSGGIQNTNLGLTPDIQQYGYRVENSPNNVYKCNIANFAQFGFFFQGNCQSDENFTRNHMVNDFFGLFITLTGIIGNQGFNQMGASPLYPNTPRGNRWGTNGTGFGSGFGAFSSNLLTGGFFFTHDNAPPLGPNIYHPSSNGLCNLQGIFLQLDDCNGPCGDVSDPTLIGSMYVSKVDSLSMQDSVITSEYNEAIKWSTQQQLYEKISHSPSITNSNSYAAAFFAEKSTEDIGQLYTIKEGFQSLVAPDSIWQYAVDSLSQTMTILQKQLDSLSLALNIANATDSLTISNRIQNTIQTYTDTRLQFESLLNTELADRQQPTELLYAQNQTLAFDSIYAQNTQIIQDIYLATFAKGIYEFTPTQVAVLEEIAHQCPLSGGQAVFDARSLYAWVAGAQFYDDTGNCAQQGLNYRQGKQNKDIYKVYPNPAKDILSIETPLSNEAYIFVLTDMSGKEILKNTLIANHTQYEINLAGIPSGLYIYHITAPTSTHSGILSLQ